MTIGAVDSVLFAINGSEETFRMERKSGEGRKAVRIRQVQSAHR
jgi:hypothetical protein